MQVQFFEEQVAGTQVIAQNMRDMNTGTQRVREKVKQDDKHIDGTKENQKKAIADLKAGVGHLAEVSC